MSRLTQETVRELAWAKGWELFQHTRRGARYLARPAWHAIFEREQPSYVFFDLQDAHRWVTNSAPAPIASRVDYDLIRWRQARAEKVRAA